MRYLLDCNVLIALTDIDHVSHDRATGWFMGSGGLFATCPITQGALMRYMLRVRPGTTVRSAKALLTQVLEIEGHRFWPDEISFEHLPETGVTGHRQVTDVYLAALAHRNKGRLATLDRTLAGLHSADAVLIS